MSDSKFERAVEITMRNEGGYVKDSGDPGGETKYGISKRSYPNLNIKQLTREQAAEIYYRDWWQRYGYGSIDYPQIAEKLFDLSVNMGSYNAHRLMQKAIVLANGGIVTVDGCIGPATIRAINAHPNPPHLLVQLKLLAISYYLSLNKSKFLAGWVRRAIS